MLTVATCFWRPNRKSALASRCYTEEWVHRLARAFKRNLTLPHRFVALTDRPYDLEVDQELLSTDQPDWSCMIEPFRIEGPLIVVGLDTVIVANIDALGEYCLTSEKMALPRSPGKDYACNGIALVPAGYKQVFMSWAGENDMDWLRAFPHEFIEERFPGWVSSYKCDVRPNGLGDSRVVYFHGDPKPHHLSDPWIREHWI